MTIINLMATETKSELLDASGNSGNASDKATHIWHTNATLGALCTKEARDLVQK
jgi:hypothetical protein